MQPFFLWGCQTATLPSFKDPKTAVKLVLYILILPLLGLLLSLYLVHSLMQEYYFDYKWVRFALSKYPTPLWKRAISLFLVLIGLGLYLTAQGLISPIFWVVATPGLGYLQVYALWAINKRRELEQF